jgi:two-component system sensor histidine kinase ChvG
VDTNTIRIDPDKLLELAPGDNSAAQFDENAFEFSINPEQVGPVLHQLVTPTHTRGRIYDRDGVLLLDSQTLSARETQTGDAGDALGDDASWRQRFAFWLRSLFTPARSRPGAGAWVTNGRSIPEIAEALSGQVSSVVRENAAGETIVSVAVPIHRSTNVRGALVLSTQGGDIDKVIGKERWSLLRFFLVLAAVMLMLSLSLANTIAEPVRRLAEAAERVRRGIKTRQPIPDFTNRTDEIGHLSRALGDMTQALYSRIDAIESFAADVAHELKNPLTSLRSAVETLPRVKSGPSQERLLSIMQHDVRRLDRLISDISDASRLDAELARGEAAPVDLAALLKAVASMLADSPRSRGASIRLDIAGAGERPCYVLGHDSRLAQVITNLIDNACSFSEPGGEVRVGLRFVQGEPDGPTPGERILISVEDDGPGIPPHALERVFERFYTDRPVERFGQNSGLGLSISRQIVEAHAGRIWAENRPLPEGAPPTAPAGEGDVLAEAPVRHAAGASFFVSLPASGP